MKTVNKKKGIKNGAENSNAKISKGYRLKSATHKKIKELQHLTNGSPDLVIGRAVKLYFRKLKSNS